MTDWQVVQRRVSLAGIVTDAATLAPLAGATVKILSMPRSLQSRIGLVRLQFGKTWDALKERADRTQTRNDGLFLFLDLPEGEYTLEASLTALGTRYGSATAKCVVSPDAQRNTKLQQVTMALPSTVVTGKILVRGQKTAISLADVRVKGSGERTFSDEQGLYTLRAIEPGQRIIQVSAQGFKGTSQTVTIKAAGDSQSVNFSLDRGS